ncbi:MAG: 4-(cytidine 5'-diphospho)-2-C-methyl-D-erythritol kinase [Nevskiales bacterium]
MLPAEVWPAPAKLNLFLHITGRRPDGYHRLQTVFQFLDFGDELQFSLRDDGLICRTRGPAALSVEDDLCLHAARALQAASGCTLGIDIALDKRLPLGGGLGGGSSNAATVLLALNRHWRLAWSLERLARLGLDLGADVPVFVHGQAAWAEGVGEILRPVTPPEMWYLVITPECAVSTREVFNDPALDRNHASVNWDDFQAGRVANDCWPVVRRRYPQVAAAFDWLDRRAAARLTGTGSSVFAAFDSASAAQALAVQIPKGWRHFVARGLNRSPLHAMLASQTPSL